MEPEMLGLTETILASPEEAEYASQQFDVLHEQLQLDLRELGQGSTPDWSSYDVWADGNEPKYNQIRDRLVKYFNSPLSVHHLRDILMTPVDRDAEAGLFSHMKCLVKRGKFWDPSYGRAMIDAVLQRGFLRQGNLEVQMSDRFRAFLYFLTADEQMNEWGTNAYVLSKITDFNTLLSDCERQKDILDLLFKFTFTDYEDRMVDEHPNIFCQRRQFGFEYVRETLTRVLATDSYSQPTELKISYCQPLEWASSGPAIRLAAAMKEWKVLARTTVPIRCLHRMYLHGFDEIVRVAKYTNQPSRALSAGDVDRAHWQIGLWAYEEATTPSARFILANTLTVNMDRLHSAYIAFIDAVLDGISTEYSLMCTPLTDLLLGLDGAISESNILDPINVEALKLLGRIKLDERVAELTRWHY